MLCKSALTVLLDDAADIGILIIATVNLQYKYIRCLVVYMKTDKPEFMIVSVEA